jgi:phytanoyl-CoA hydroxylase
MSEADFYRENGYVHARGVFDAAEIEEMRAALDRILADVEGTANDANHRWSAAEKETVLKGFHNVQYHDAAFMRAAAHPRMVELLTQLIGPNVQLHHTTMLVKRPEKGAPFPMHQDYPYFPHEQHTVVAASVHLDDTNEENGSHKLGPLEPTGESNDLDTPRETRLRFEVKPA